MSVENAEARSGQEVLEVAHADTVGARDHEFQDQLAGAQTAGFAGEATDDLTALCVPEAAGAASIGSLREPRMVG